jgi:hypothetical protein
MIAGRVFPYIRKKCSPFRQLSRIFLMDLIWTGVWGGWDAWGE